MRKLRSVLSASVLSAAVLSATILPAASLCGCQADSGNSGLTPVTLSEVAHSIFYAPQYAAIELGYFEEEGIDCPNCGTHLEFDFDCDCCDDDCDCCCEDAE